MNGKNKCKLLKEIRRQIAAENDIAYVTSECKYQGDCTGTCPKCESEVRYLEEQLRLRQKAGKAVAVAGIAAALMVTASGCDYPDFPNRAKGGEVPGSGFENVVDGDVALPEDALVMGKAAVETTREETVPPGGVPNDTENMDGSELWGFYKPPEETELLGDVPYVPEDTTGPELMGEPTEPVEMVLKGFIVAPGEE